MAILKAVNPKKANAKLIKNIVCYVLQDKKTEKILTYGKDVDVATCAEQMNKTKEFWNKTSGREYYHFVQSFPPNEKITPEQALEMAKNFLEQSKAFDGYEVLLATHKDKKHIHTHFIVNSVSLKNGLKFQYSRKDLASWKAIQDRINQENGFQKAVEKGFTQDGEKRVETVSSNRATYELLKKAEMKKADSYIQSCALSVLKNAKRAQSKNEFCELMGKDGFKTDWIETRKNVVFTDTKRKEAGESKCKVRLSRLFDYYNIETFDKEALANEFTRNSERAGISKPAGGNFGQSGLAPATNEQSDKFHNFQQRSKQFDDFQRTADAVEGAERARKEELEQQRKLAEEQRGKHLQQLEEQRKRAEQKNRAGNKRNERNNGEGYGISM